MRYKLSISSWDQMEQNAIKRVISSDQDSMDKEVLKYEEMFSDYIGAKHTIMVNSGSSANLLMIASLFFSNDSKKRLTQGDEIIVPSVSWSTTYAPLQQYGLKLKFVDIDSKTLNIDLDQLEAAITDKTRAILAVNLLGNPNDFKIIQQQIKNKNILLLEDNCESLGASYNGKNAGTFGLMGTFSSFFSHHISTMEGGCITTDDDELDHIMRSLRAHGWTRDLPNPNYVSGNKSKFGFEEAFKFCLPGYNLRPLEMSGAIGQEQLKKLPKFIDMRKDNAEYFKSKIKQHEYISLQEEIGSSSWFGFSIVLHKQSPISRNELVNQLEEYKIESRPIVTGNFLKNKSLLQYFDYEVHGKHKNAENIDKNGFFLGNHHVDLRKEIDYFGQVLERIFKK